MRLQVNVPAVCFVQGLNTLHSCKFCYIIDDIILFESKIEANLTKCSYFLILDCLIF